MSGAQPASPIDSRAGVQQLPFENGLTVVWEEDHRQPLVAIEVRIQGGLRGEGPYVGTGITHFIEHMLFKGTPTRPPGSIEQEVRRYGGTINAFTSLDTTGVSLFVESRYLKDSLAMLADILQHAVFDEQEFQKERAVIISEIQMNEDDPDRRLHHLFWNRHYLEHPYRHPILGYQSLLEELTVEDLRKLYAAQYQPQNIAIACAGDLEASTITPLMQELFGDWKRGVTDPLQQIVPPEPPPASAKEVIVERPVQHAYSMLGFLSTRLSDPDLYPLDVLANILGHGKSSRLYDTLVRKRQLAHIASAWNYTPSDPGVFGMSLRTDPEKMREAIDGVTAILREIQEHGVSAAELSKAKRSVSADYVFNLQTVEARAGDLANSLIATGDPLFSRRYVTGIEQVTTQQVQEAARRYCDHAKMTTAIIRPPVAAPAAPPRPERSSDPIPMTKTMLKNGVTVIVGEESFLPMAAVVVGFRGGVRVESEAEQGLSNLVAQMLTKGTKRRTALAIAQEVESLGGVLEPFSGRDGFGLVLQVLSQDLTQGVNLLQELISESTFPEEELAIQRHLIAKQLQAQEDEIFDMGGRLMRQTLFPSHPYRFNPLGSRASLEQLSRAHCMEFARQRLVGSNLVTAIVGRVETGSIQRHLEQVFGTLPKGEPSWPELLTEQPLTGVRESLLRMDREQALIMLGFRGSTYRAQERSTLDVMTAMLSGMAGRLFQSVRETHGLSYTLGAVNVPAWDPGYVLVYAATRPQERSRVLELLTEQLRKAAAEGFTEKELDQAKRHLVGHYRLELQQLAGVARQSVLDELYGLGYDAWKRYEERINAVTLDIVNEAAARYLTVDQRAQVIISPNGPAH